VIVSAQGHTQQPRTADAGHVPVMAEAVLAALAPRDGGVYVDATFGRGGYSKAILDAADSTVWGIDRDPTAIAAGADLARRYHGRLNLLQGRFGELDRLMEAEDALPVDGVAFDLGVSSPQLDTPERGFSFRHDGPLDMRMGSDGPSAADIVNEMPEAGLARLIFELGEERKARRVAKAIAAARAKAPLTRTHALADVVRQAVGPAKAHDIDPATRTFQALRIHVNDELGELARGLRAAERALKAGGRLVVVAFHSLEDRVVKRFLRERSGDLPRASRHSPLPDTSGAPAPTFTTLQRAPRKADEDEARANPRARSARLRAAERTAAPAWPSDLGMEGGRA
jgi:16S rRNA (cytosine1402-N4)-methyltransferase